jgi:TetR/AcrR family transcriptional regulator
MPDTINQMVSPSAKNEILDQALALFAEKGFDGASTREIAESAGVNHALIKYHFGGKLALWKSAVGLLFMRLDEMLTSLEREIVDIQDPKERLRRALGHYIRYCAEHPEHARIMVQESTSENDRLAWAVEEHIAKTKTLIGDLFEELMDSGDIPKISRISLRYIVSSACQSIFTLGAEVQLLYGVSSEHEAQIESHIDAVTKLLLR